MSLVKIRRITLPSDIRQAFGVKERDDLEVERVEGGVMLRLVAVVDRETARRRLMEMLDDSRARSRYVGPGPAPPDAAHYIPRNIPLAIPTNVLVQAQETTFASSCRVHEHC